MPVETVIAVFLHCLHLVDKPWSDAIDLVVLNVRGPWTGTTILVGATLAMAGATYQILFRNPLVSPAVLGVPAGAGFGAALGVICDLSSPGIQGMAFICGHAAVAMASWLPMPFRLLSDMASRAVMLPD
jgi:iron complex transport system permease protein